LRTLEFAYVTARKIWNGVLDLLTCSRVKMVVRIEFPAYTNPITPIKKSPSALKHTYDGLTQRMLQHVKCLEWLFRPFSVIAR